MAGWNRSFIPVASQSSRASRVDHIYVTHNGTLTLVIHVRAVLDGSNRDETPVFGQSSCVGPAAHLWGELLSLCRSATVVFDTGGMSRVVLKAVLLHLFAVSCM